MIFHKKDNAVTSNVDTMTNKVSKKQVRIQKRKNSIYERAVSQKHWLWLFLVLILFVVGCILTCYFLTKEWAVVYFDSFKGQSIWDDIQHFFKSGETWKIVVVCLVYVITVIFVSYFIVQLIKLQGKMLWNIVKFRHAGFWFWFFIALFTIPLFIITVPLAIWKNSAYITQKAREEAQLKQNQEDLQRMMQNQRVYNSYTYQQLQEMKKDMINNTQQISKDNVK